jgi:hypothetical protein
MVVTEQPFKAHLLNSMNLTPKKEYNEEQWNSRLPAA